MKNKKQEDAGPSRGQLETIRRAEFLVNSSALTHYLTHEFYDILLAHASMHENIGEDSASVGYGFAMYIYDTADRTFCHFDEKATGLGGFGGMICDAVRWIDDLLKNKGKESDFSSKLVEVGNPRRVDDELDDDPSVLRNLVVFANAWESVSDFFCANDGWLNMYFEYFPVSTDMPEKMDFGCIEFKGCNQYPGGTLEMFQFEAEKMKDAIEDGPDPECPEPPDGYDVAE